MGLLASGCPVVVRPCVWPEERRRLVAGGMECPVWGRSCQIGLRRAQCTGARSVPSTVRAAASLHAQRATAARDSDAAQTWAHFALVAPTLSARAACCPQCHNGIPTWPHLSLKLLLFSLLLLLLFVAVCYCLLPPFMLAEHKIFSQSTSSFHAPPGPQQFILPLVSAPLAAQQQLVAQQGAPKRFSISL